MPFLIQIKNLCLLQDVCMFLLKYFDGCILYLISILQGSVPAFVWETQNILILKDIDHVY